MEKNIESNGKSFVLNILSLEGMVYMQHGSWFTMNLVSRIVKLVGEEHLLQKIYREI